MKKTLMTSLTLMAFSALAHAQAPEFELVCRAKAKEIAADAYRGCVTESRSQQIDQIKKDYQDKLKQMKQDYESELKKLNGGKSASSGAAGANMSSMNSEGSGIKSSLKKSISKKIAKMKATAKGLPNKQITTTTVSSDDMTVEIKSAAAANAPIADESTLDIPEPMPIEEVPTT